MAVASVRPRATICINNRSKKGIMAAPVCCGPPSMADEPTMHGGSRSPNAGDIAGYRCKMCAMPPQAQRRALFLRALNAIRTSKPVESEKSGVS